MVQTAPWTNNFVLFNHQHTIAAATDRLLPFDNFSSDAVGTYFGFVRIFQ